MVEIKRGDIFWGNLEPSMGSEQRGVRPLLIIQNDLRNKYSTTTIVAPLTSNMLKKEYPTNVFIGSFAGLKKDSTILLNQVRTLDKKRIIKKIGSLDNFTMHKVDNAIKISLGLN